jgi:uncharacterized membrane protein YgdD (TMEM256/DUF423 family)
MKHPADTAVRTGAASGLLAVLLGAFGAHALRSRIPPEQLEVFRTAVQYHAIHALAILLTGALQPQAANPKALRAAAAAFLVGTALFSGSLYLLAVTGIKLLGIITPFGGVCFLAGWILLYTAHNRRPPQNTPEEETK